MKKIITLAAAPIVLLLLSASVEAATDAPAAQRQGAALYCWKDKLYTAGNDLVCNWADDAKEACYGGKVSNVSKESIVAEPVTAKRCESGEWLVRVTKK